MTSRSNVYVIGYRKPPKNHRFRKGESGNPSGKRRKASAPDLKAQLQSALNKTVTIRSGKHQKVISKGAAGIDQLVNQFASGDRNARRDLIVLCEKLGVDLTNREALEGALEDVLTAQDEAILADFVKRHGGQYPVSADTIAASPPAKDAKLLTSPTQNAKPLASAGRSLIESQSFK
jgi:hypothetical protein